ncbi:cell division protein FtsB [Janthinobacterium sp. CG_23.3]|uniref:hypothetical protein n=1 Tax=unclassified Janthinobacterium TaxID=2610881 RepID=UPI00037E926A|nr:hypothetical protein [Janthinobacterium sp. CG3]
MDITINETLRSFIDPLTDSEYTALERSLLAEGCRDALVLWNDVLIDGHNRYAICRKHNITYKTVQNIGFASLDDVMLWMIDNHLARRSVSDFQRGVLALRKKDIVAAKTVAPAPAADDGAGPPWDDTPPLSTREDIARAARLSSNQIGQIEKIQKAATPELVEAVRSGTISINAAATVASLPQAEQVAAVAGGRKQLQQAAKEIREQRAAARPPKAPKEGVEPGQGDADERAAPTELERLRAEVAQLQERVAELRTQNAALNERIAVLVDAS